MFLQTYSVLQLKLTNCKVHVTSRCRNCSDVVIKEPWGDGIELINEKTIAEGT